MPQHRITHHDAELEVTYDFERACAPQRERGGGNIVDPGNGAGVTITAVHLVDEEVARLRNAVAKLLPYAESRVEDLEAVEEALKEHPVVDSDPTLLVRAQYALTFARDALVATADHVGPELTDDWFTDKDRRSFEAELLEHERDADADAREQALEDRYDAEREERC